VIASNSLGSAERYVSWRLSIIDCTSLTNACISSIGTSAFPRVFLMADLGSE
jgi:hypothetical protein